MARNNPLIDAVAEDCQKGRLALYRRGGKEFRRPASLPGVWLCEDGHAYSGRDLPVRRLPEHAAGHRTLYVAFAPAGVRYWLPLARAVYAAFTGGLAPGHYIRFADGRPENCSLANLVPTPASYLRRRPKPSREDAAATRQLDDAEARLAGYLHSRGKSAESIARRLGCLPGSVELALAEVKAGQRAGGAGRGESPLA